TKNDLPQKSLENASKILGETQGKTLLGIHIGVHTQDINHGKEAGNLIKGCIKYLNEHPEILPIIISDKRYSSVQEEAIKEMSLNLTNPFIVYNHSNVWLTCALLSLLDGVLTTKLHVGITA